MTVFEDKNKTEKFLRDVWNMLIRETDFGAKLREDKISLHFIISNPEFDIFVDENGPVFGEKARKKNPVITMKMASGDVHRLWQNNIDLPKAIALRQIKVKGPVNKILKILPLLKPDEGVYAEYCKQYGFF